MHCVSNTIVIHFAPIAYAFSALCHTGTHKLCSPPCLLYFRSRSPFLLPLPSSFTTAICFGHLVLISLATTGCSAQPHPCLQRSVSLSLSLPPFFNGGGFLPCCPRILLLLLYSPPPSNNLLFRSVLFISNFWGLGAKSFLYYTAFIYLSDTCTDQRNAVPFMELPYT